MHLACQTHKETLLESRASPRMKIKVFGPQGGRKMDHEMKLNYVEGKLLSCREGANGLGISHGQDDNDN